MTDNHVAHHFDDAGQQYEAANLGMWTFLITEIMFFGGAFAGYAAYRVLHFEAFARASQHLDLVLGAINTVVLLTSSLSIALAVHAAQVGHTRKLIRFLWLTIGLGVLFFIIKSVEYSHKFADGMVPGANFAYAGQQAHLIEMFYVFYFTMTGIHALHVVIGLGLMAWLIHGAKKARFSPAYHTPVEMVGLYWHFVDIVWIFLFPLLYLIER